MSYWLGEIIYGLEDVTRYIPADNSQRALLDTSINNLKNLQANIYNGEKARYEKIEDVRSSVGSTPTSPDAALQGEF